MDGVLVDSEPIINAAAIRALAEFGIQARPEDFRRSSAQAKTATWAGLRNCTAKLMPWK